MNRDSKIFRAAVAAVLAAAFAGSGFATVASAMGVAAGGAVWLSAMLAAAICAVAAASGAGALLGLPLLTAAAGGYALIHLRDLRAIRALFAAWQGGEVDVTQIAPGGRALLIFSALIFGALFFVMLYHRGFTGMAIMFLAALLIFSHSMSASASIAAAAPGLAAAAAAFAMSEGMPGGFAPARALMLSALALALAMMFLPAGRVTWKPLENLASRVRAVFEQYFNYTHERIAFSISEEGYNYGGEINGQAVAMLGGPANPDPKPVMVVTGSAPLLLRGTIRATYTGYSWVDVTPKNRYLYYDVTHRNVRDRVFDLTRQIPGEAFTEITGQVELLDSGTSTLFTPGRMTAFDMDLSIAVYYNSSGEMFMAREAQPGDTYVVTTLNPVYGDALKSATLWAEGERDDQYEAIRAAHTQLPEGIEAGVYELTRQITASADSEYAKAAAIADYLRRNMRYKLDVPYPPRGRDFASYFLLDAKEGYCSYFATAMAVMGRIAGLPTRYVEGYYARPDASGKATLTGKDAHAWAEVYFRGLGWIPFDTTNGGPSGGGFGGDEGAFGFGEASDDDEISPFDDPSAPADGETDDDIANTYGGAPYDSPTPEPDQSPDDNPDESPDDDQDEAPPENDSSEDQSPPPDAAPDDANRPSLAPWLLLLLLLILAALLTRWIWTRLRATDLERLCRQSRRAQVSSMMIYRATLTLLAHMGQLQQGGETPEAFAERMARELQNSDYADFSRAVAMNRYGNRPLRKDDAEQGLRAYRRFLKAMRPGERVRFMVTRLFRGLGDFDNIP